VTDITRIDTRVVEPVFLIVALVLFQPILSRLEQALDRIFLRDPNDYRNVLRQLGRDLLGTLELEILLTRSTHTIADAMLLRSARIVALSRDACCCTRRRAMGADPASASTCATCSCDCVRQRHVRVLEVFDGIGDLDRALLVNRLDTRCCCRSARAAKRSAPAAVDRA
jgi:hypothetical protein